MFHGRLMGLPSLLLFYSFGLFMLRCLVFMSQIFFGGYTFFSFAWHFHFFWYLAQLLFLFFAEGGDFLLASYPLVFLMV